MLALPLFVIHLSFVSDKAKVDPAPALHGQPVSGPLTEMITPLCKSLRTFMQAVLFVLLMFGTVEL